MEKLLKKILTVIKKKPDSSQAYEDLYYMCEEAMKTDEALAVKYLKLLSQVIENRIPKTKEDKMLRFLFGLHKKVLLAVAPFDFDSYLLYIEWNREPEKKFYENNKATLAIKNVKRVYQKCSDENSFL